MLLLFRTRLPTTARTRPTRSTASPMATAGADAEFAADMLARLIMEAVVSETGALGVDIWIDWGRPLLHLSDDAAEIRKPKAENRRLN